MFMKKISLLAIAFAALGSAMAQDGTQQGTGKDFKPLRTPMSKATRFGLEAGVNMAKVNDNDYSYDLNTNSKTGFHFGFFVNVPLAGGLRFQPGLQYNGYGSKLNVRGNFPLNATGTMESAEQDFHYVSLPLIFQLQSRSGLYGEFGPQLGYLVNAEMEYQNRNVKNYNRFDRVDVGAALGLGYLSRVGLGVHARYNWGLTNIVREPENAEGPELKNRVLSIGLVYHFGAAK
jgi:hypothetical protein